MSWNQRSKIVAVGIAIQSVAGTFTAPAAPADLIAVSVPTNDTSAIVATDPTATGAIFDAPDIYLGATGTAGGTIPLRGYGSGSLPAASAWVPGRILQAAGFAEVRNATPVTGTAQAGPAANSIKLASAESSVNDFWLGSVVQHTGINAVSGVRQFTPILDYDGTSKNALTGLPLGTTIVSGTYTIPAQLAYVLGTQSTPPPLLSISVWRDKKRFDYEDCRLTNLVIDMPVGNEANTGFPSIQFTAKGNPVVLEGVDDTAPQLAATTLQTQPATCRGGSFYIDRTLIEHQDLKYTQGGTVAAASNQNKDAGQDGYDVLGGTRAFDFDINQMNVTDFDLGARIAAQTVLPVISVWGVNVGNRFAFAVPNMVLRPMSPGDRNGYVNLTGAGQTTDISQSVTLAVF